MVFYSVNKLTFFETYTINSLHLAILSFLLILFFFRKYNERCEEGFSTKGYKSLVIFFSILSFVAPLSTNLSLYFKKENEIAELKRGEFKLVKGKVEKLKRDARGTNFEVDGVKFFIPKGGGIPLLKRIIKNVDQNMILEIKYLENGFNSILEIQESS